MRAGWMPAHPHRFSHAHSVARCEAAKIASRATARSPPAAASSPHAGRSTLTAAGRPAPPIVRLALADRPGPHPSHPVIARLPALLQPAQSCPLSLSAFVHDSTPHPAGPKREHTANTTGVLLMALLVYLFVRTLQGGSAEDICVG